MAVAPGLVLAQQIVQRPVVHIDHPGRRLERAGKISVGQVGEVQAGADDHRAPQGGAGHIRAGEVRAAEIGPVQQRAHQPRSAQLGAGEVGVGEVGGHGRAQLGAGQVGAGDDGDIRLATAAIVLEDAETLGAILQGDAALAQIRAGEVGLGQVGAAQAGATQVGLGQVGVAQVGVAQVGGEQCGPAEIGALQGDAVQAGGGQVGLTQVHPVQRAMAQVHMGEIGPATAVAPSQEPGMQLQHPAKGLGIEGAQEPTWGRHGTRSLKDATLARPALRKGCNSWRGECQNQPFLRNHQMGARPETSIRIRAMG